MRRRPTSRDRQPSPGRVALVAGLLIAVSGVWPGAPAVAVEITDLAIERGAVSPNGDGLFDTDSLRFTYASADPTLWQRVTLNRDGAVEFVIFGLESIDATGSRELIWDGRDSLGTIVDEGVYDLVLELSDTGGADRDSVTVSVDLTGPGFTDVFLGGPERAYANGDYLTITCRLTETPDSLWIDVSAADDDTLNYASIIIQPHSATEFGILYRLSPGNTTPDGRSLVLPISARDGVANVSRNADIAICLSNFPPLFESASLERAGIELPDSVAYTAGDTIRVVGRFQTVIDTLIVRADFGAIDSEYHFISRPAVLDTSFATVLPDTERIEPEYGYRITARLHYVLSDQNERPEGYHEIGLTADDLGCGAVGSRPVLAGLFELGPAPPRWDPGIDELARAETINLTGVAPGAARIEIYREDGEPAGDAPIGDPGGEFAVEVTLDPGWNRFTAIAYDAFDHPSRPSTELAVYRADEARIDVGPRFRPGDTILVALAAPASRIDLAIFNLAGDRIWTDTVIEPGEIHEFTWSGRNRSGDMVQSGPYIAHLTIHTGGRADETNRAFVFTRE